MQFPSGTIVTDFVAESDAARTAGVAVGDIIVGFDERSVRTLDDLVNSIRLYKVGDTITLHVLRDGTALEFGVTLGERPEGL